MFSTFRLPLSMINNNREWTTYIASDDLMVFILKFIEFDNTQITPRGYIQILFKYDHIIQILNLEKYLS